MVALPGPGDSNSERSPQLNERARATSISVVVADDDPIARRIICDAVTAGGLAVAAEAVTQQEAVSQTLRHEPDVLVVDLDMPDGDLSGTIRTIQSERSDDVQILVLANLRDDAAALASFEAGASGFLSKADGIESLPRAVRALAAGEAVIPRAFGRLVLERMRRGQTSDVGLRPVRSPLTPREWEVFDLMSTGCSTDEIAATLFVSIETVRSHVKAILRKLEVRSRAEAVAKGPLLRSLS